ncbi:MAG: M48 family metallopeptidase [Oleiphilaceae bacterium]|nr:M48 family metallopeptidase [Oleiphilus sp. HI0067]KZY69731.1 hypothetical protein A3739_00925 [Oleiphilus sp. HI0067]MCH2158443.1 M48 family metallopeptidase [Oleiphilaceae bacterium]
MNFYLAQEEARKQSQRLILLFCLAVFVLVVLTNALFVVFVWFSDIGNLAGTQRINVSSLPWYQALLAIIDNFGWDKIAIVSAIIVSVIAVATWSKWSDLSKGGHVVAELLGGKRVSPDTKELHERRLINVVEEMALAASMAVPPAYVLTNEQGINAFAAGVSSDDAVVAVSQGALMQLNRDQLQGVVAHEFSHILNGDMRLNVRVVATLHGLTMINETGRILMEAGSRRSYRRSYGFSNSSRKNNGGQFVIFIAGLALWLLGTVGQFFGEVIKAALSRQREYLADASAVQFTRNPTGIGEALQIIGGYGKHSKIDNPRAHELGHFFFSAAFNSRLFATHPSVDERIERLLPNWNGQYAESTAEAELRSEFGDAVMGFSGGSLHAEDLSKAVQSESSGSSDISFEFQEQAAAEPAFNLKSLLERVHTSYDAKGVYYAFIGHESVATNDWSERIAPLSLSQKLDLLRAAIPSLKTLSKEEYSAFRSSYLQVISADKKRSLSEWLGFELFRNPCDRFFGLAKPVKPKYKNIESIAGFYRIAVTKFVQMGTRTTRDQLAAIEAAGKASGIDLAGTKLALNISTKEFTTACSELKKAYPLLTPRLIKGLLAAAEVDGKVCEIEQKLVSILAAIWDLPLPTLEMSEAA